MLARVLVVVVVVLAGALRAQQLKLEPYPAEVGQEVVVRALRDGAPIPALSIALEPGTDDAARGEASVVALGATDARGELRFRPERAGQQVLAATIDGVRTLAPLAVRPARARWPLALGAVPLGLALLWWNLSRARGRRGP